MNPTQFDLVILGSGSTAFAAALRAREMGKTVLMTEERTLGGTCVNRGCLPSKNLIEAARIIHEANHPRYPGISPTKINFDFAALIAQKDEVIAGYRQKKYASLLSAGQIDVEQGHAEFVDPNTIEVSGKRYSATRILIATGSRPTVPSIPGLDQVPFFTSDLLTSGEAMEMKALPRSVVIVGGGYIALELGQMFQRLGSQVTIVERGSQVLAHGYEPATGPTIAEVLKAEGVKLVTNVVVEGVRRDGDEIVVLAGGNDLRAEALIVATGRRPNTDKIGIEASGVRIGEHEQVVVDAFLRTNVGHVFAAGDVIGMEQRAQMATPVGSRDGGIVAHNAFADDPRAVDHRVIPRVIFTDPAVATVGMTEAEAIAAGHSCWCKTVPMSLVPRANAIHDTKGIIKMVADADSNAVLGVTMVGKGAEEVIHEAAMGLRFRAKVTDFIDLLHVYPTMAEALKIVAISRYKDPAKLSCCAD